MLLRFSETKVVPFQEKSNCFFLGVLPREEACPAKAQLIRDSRWDKNGQLGAPGWLSRLKRPTLDFGSGRDLVVREVESRIRLCTHMLSF